MNDAMDFATAIKNVRNQMPEEAKLIDKYIGFLKSKANLEIDPSAERVKGEKGNG